MVIFIAISMVLHTFSIPKSAERHIVKFNSIRYEEAKEG